MKTKCVGRGWRGYRKGEIVKCFNDITVGRKYLEYSPQFQAKNVIQVVRGDTTGLNRSIVYAQFVRPYGNEQHEFAIWGHDIVTGTVKLWEVVS